MKIRLYKVRCERRLFLTMYNKYRKGMAAESESEWKDLIDSNDGNVGNDGID